MNGIGLKNIRKRLSISQFRLSKMSGVSRYKISLLESGYLECLSIKENQAISKIFKKIKTNSSDLRDRKWK